MPPPQRGVSISGSFPLTQAQKPALPASLPHYGQLSAALVERFALGLALPIMAALSGRDGVGQTSNGDPVFSASELEEGGRTSLQVAPRSVSGRVIALPDGIMARGAPIHANRVKALVSKMFNFAIAQDLVEVACSPQATEFRMTALIRAGRWGVRRDYRIRPERVRSQSAPWAPRGPNWAAR